MSKYPIPDDCPTVTIGGRERRLFVSMTDLYEFQQRSQNGELEGMKGTIEMLYGALKADDPELTVEDVGEMVPMHQIARIIPKVYEAYGIDPERAKASVRPLVEAQSGTDAEGDG